MSFGKLRQDYHRRLYEQVLSNSRNCESGSQYPSFIAGTSQTSSDIARGIVRRIEFFDAPAPHLGRSVGAEFINLTAAFIESAFQLMRQARLGKWLYSKSYTISQIDRYEHLENLDRSKIPAHDPLLQSALGDGYILWPDIIVGRQPINEEESESFREALEHDLRFASRTTLHESNAGSSRTLLHASVSCNWTIQSEHVESSRSEAYNLIRSSLGRIPYIAVVTAEPLPHALGGYRSWHG